MLALTAVHPMTWIATGPTAGGQIIADQTSGPKAKTLYGLGTIINDTSASGTQCPIGYIDGVQSLGKVIVLSVQSVAASDGTNSVYSVDNGVSQLAVGDKVTIVGFADSNNNVTNAAVAAVSSTTVTVANTSGTAQSAQAATLKTTKGGVPAAINLFLTAGTGDSTVAQKLVTTLFASAITDTGFTLNFPTITTAGAQFTFGATVIFGS